MKKSAIKFQFMFPVTESLDREDGDISWKIELAGEPCKMWVCSPEQEEARIILRALTLRHVADLFEIYGPAGRPGFSSTFCDGPALYFGWNLPLDMETAEDGTFRLTSPNLPLPAVSGSAVRPVQHAHNEMLVHFLRYLADAYLSGNSPPEHLLRDPGVFLPPPEDLKALPDPWWPEDPVPETHERSLTVRWNIPVEVSTSDGFELRAKVRTSSDREIAAEARGLTQESANRALLISVMLKVADHVEATGEEVQVSPDSLSPVLLALQFCWRFRILLTELGGKWTATADGFSAGVVGGSEAEVRCKIFPALLREMAEKLAAEPC